MGIICGGFFGQIDLLYAESYLFLKKPNSNKKYNKILIFFSRILSSVFMEIK